MTHGAIQFPFDTTISPQSVMDTSKVFSKDRAIEKAQEKGYPPVVPSELMTTSPSVQEETSPSQQLDKTKTEKSQLDHSQKFGEAIGFVGGFLWPRKTWNGVDTNIGPFLRMGSLAALFLWLVGIYLLYRFCPAESFEYLDGTERSANMAVLTVLICTNASRLLHLVVRDRTFVFVNSGVMIGSITVQFIAMASIISMVAYPTPVLLDPVTGLRMHMVRWVEWVVLAFLMTFLTESIDMPLKDSKGSMISWIHGIIIGLSTAAGLVFPFCKSWRSWLAVFTVSWVLFCSLYVRLFIRYRRFKNIPSEGSYEVKDEYERAKYSLKTIAICAVVWTLLAISYSIIAILKPFVPEGSFFSSDSLILVTESIFELISKVWYLNLLIEVHNIVFDDASRTVKRMEELRVVMSTIWNASSDVMVWCSSEGNCIHAVVSPSFFDLSDPPNDLEKLRRLAPNYKKPTLLLEVDQQDESFSYHIIHMNMGSAITRQDAVDVLLRKSQKEKLQPLDTAASKNVEALAELLIEIFNSKENEMVLMTEMHTQTENKTGARRLACEAKVSKLDSSCLVVIRDVSERFQRFETEKKLVEEITARKKDAEANRFSRHEVKNSILAAIGVLDSMRGTSTTHQKIVRNARIASEDDDGFESRIMKLSNHKGSNTPTDTNIGFHSFEEHAVELDNTLRRVLDTIMDHAMSREVIYEEYEVRKERVMVPEVLSKIRRQASSHGAHLSLTSFPANFPILGMDPRLLRYIYQNALSNASRYGKRGGPIDTFIYYDHQNQEFRMDVVNLPGVGHEELLEMTHEEVQAQVFSPRSRLHNKCREKQEISESNSSGDGAWIMKKCSAMLKGDCDIRFEPDRTVFSFWCPARDHHSREFKEPELTALPTNTWGIVIDDSSVQRKLMDRFLKIAGIDESRRVVVGKNAEEIYGFNDMVVALVHSHPDDKFIVIADENLDVVEGAATHGTVSGSLSLQKLLSRLEPADNARVLALVRSANDSAKETDLYKTRAHGYLVKAPIDKKEVLRSIQTWWFKRFPPKEEEGFHLSSHHSSSSLDLEQYDPFVDIRENLEMLTAFSMTSPTSQRKRWGSIQERLQTLKGDLKSIIPRGGPDLLRVVQAIDKLRGGECPDEFFYEWRILHKGIDALLDSQRSSHN